MNSTKKLRETIEWERLELSWKEIGKNWRCQENISNKAGPNKGQNSRDLTEAKEN